MSTVRQHTSASSWEGAAGAGMSPSVAAFKNGAGEQAGAQGKKGRTAPSSLVISPNLDALLEHEERTRARNAEPGTPESSQQSGSLSPSESGVETQPAGLPPPPRYSRGPKSPRTPLTGNLALFAELKTTEPPIEETPLASPILPVSSSTSNPYINPAPSLVDVLGDGAISRYVSGGKDRASPGKDEGGPASRDGSEALPWSPTWKQRSPSKYAASGHVDRLQIGKAQKAENKAESPPTSPGAFGAVRAKLVRKKSMKATGMDDREGAMPWRRRPLISHGPQASVSSSDSASTNGPPSTAEHEPRISISSTIYPASSDHSHSHSLYNTPMHDHRNSFMEIYSPTNPEFPPHLDSPASIPPSPIYFAESPTSSFASSTKPPIPTAPKPLFTRPSLRSRQPSPMPAATPPPMPNDTRDPSLPPTTNFLDTDERAELIKKSRKLTRVFGETPAAHAMAHQDGARCASNPARNQNALSLAHDGSRPRSAWRATAETLHLTGSRRHSMPLTPDDVSFLSIVSPTFDSTHSPRTSLKLQKHRKDMSSSDLSLNHVKTQLRSNSPTSFIDISDDENSKPVTKKATATPRPHSPTQSIISTMSLEDTADEDRRRKRERLAKLHRFLGSRVPANLVLGIDDLEASLPPPASSESDDGVRKAWMKRRRSSSAAMLPTYRPDDLERVKEELDDKEKAINVRRAHKMEQVFGVAPPQTLFHTRQIPAASASKPLLIPSPATPPADVASAPVQRNTNRSTYIKTKPKKNSRPGTSESSKQLLPKEFGGLPDAAAAAAATLSPSAAGRHSFIYNHYQHSLNSLNDIMDRDDRESLAELHEYLNNADVPTPTGTPKVAADDELAAAQRDRRLSVASSIKSERRRSLPARTSMISLAPSEFTISTPKADAFQLRRRRAAKLTQFFGVNYRELINDVLESIENGVEHEQQRGTLRAEEVEDLLTKLRTLKIKRTSLF